MSFDDLSYSWDESFSQGSEFQYQSFTDEDFPLDFYQESFSQDMTFPVKPFNENNFFLGPELPKTSQRTSSHSRNSSHSSTGTCFSAIAVDLPIITRTQSRSPPRQLGPLLLPKIRSQDQVIETPRRVAKQQPAQKAWASPPSMRRPGHTRAYSVPTTLMPLMPPSPPQSRASSVSLSPESIISTQHQRRNSTQTLNNHALAMYSYPTYRQTPSYIPSMDSQSLFPTQSYLAPSSREPSPLAHSICFEDLTVESQSLSTVPTTNLISYLTTSNPSPAVVERTSYVRDVNAKHHWWDVRQIRPWTSFSSGSISSNSHLQNLLTTPIDASLLPEVAHSGTTYPTSELALSQLLSKFYTIKLNTALRQAQGQRHLLMRTAHHKDEPTFLSAYVDDAEKTVFGHAHVVGLVKSWETWNVGMRTDQNHKRVEYLRGLSELHRHMRERHCRYGFILTETDLTVVRNGAENPPHFGYLEVHTVSLSASSESEDRNEFPLTAMTALFYLHLLAQDTPLPGNPSYRSEIGAAAQGTRQNCLPRDKWMPEPQLAEKRMAKRARGWVWPEEPVTRKELGRRGVCYGGAKK